MKKSSLYLILCCLLPIGVWAQQNTIKGMITDQEGSPLPGASIVEQGTTNGVVSDFDGAFSLVPTQDQVTLEVSFVGFRTAYIRANVGSHQNIVLEEDASQLDEVVVTALNISREEKSLGYAVAKVEGEEITKSVSGNWMNSMSGKVPGLFFAQAGTGPSGSIRVTLRGDQSLNYGGNEALIVVDGVPISSGMTATKAVSNYAQGDAPVDYGDGLSDINPEDIESISVLKGPSAAALYGSRAANGAIMITTKSGKRSRGLGITINSTVSFENAGFFPDFQTEYGNGSDMGLQPYSLWELTEDMAPDGVATNRHYSRYTFGERFDPNTMRYLYSSKNWEDGTFSKRPWVYQDDWYTGLFRTGITTNNTVSINGNNGQGTSSRLSFTDYKNDWIMPNTGFNRQSVSL